MLSKFASGCAAFVGSIVSPGAYTVITGGIAATQSVITAIPPNACIVLGGCIIAANTAMLLAYANSGSTCDDAKHKQWQSRFDMEQRLCAGVKERIRVRNQNDPLLRGEWRTHVDNINKLVSHKIYGPKSFLVYMFDNGVDRDVPTALLVAKSTLCMSVLPLVLYNARHLGNWIFAGVFLSLIAFNSGMKIVSKINRSRSSKFNFAVSCQRNIDLYDSKAR